MIVCDMSITLQTGENGIVCQYIHMIVCDMNIMLQRADILINICNLGDINTDADDCVSLIFEIRLTLITLQF